MLGRRFHNTPLFVACLGLLKKGVWNWVWIHFVICVLTIVQLLFNNVLGRFDISPMLSSRETLGTEGGIPLDTFVQAEGTNDTAGQDPPGLIIKDPIGEKITDVFSNAEPIARTFPSGRPGIFMVKVENGLPKGELEPCRYVRSNASAVLTGAHLSRKTVI